MDNNNIQITSSGYDNILHAFSIATSKYRKAVGYAIYHVREVSSPSGRTEYVATPEDKNTVPCLVFYWTHPSSPPPEYQKLAYEHGVDAMARFAHEWLDSLNMRYYFDDIDGDTGKGFTAFTDYWGHVLSRWEAIVGIFPVPALYGK